MVAEVPGQRESLFIRSDSHMQRAQDQWIMKVVIDNLNIVNYDVYKDNCRQST